MSTQVLEKTNVEISKELVEKTNQFSIEMKDADATKFTHALQQLFTDLKEGGLTMHVAETRWVKHHSGHAEFIYSLHELPELADKVFMKEISAGNTTKETFDYICSCLDVFNQFTELLGTNVWKSRLPQDRFLGHWESTRYGNHTQGFFDKLTLKETQKLLDYKFKDSKEFIDFLQEHLDEKKAALLEKVKTYFQSMEPLHAIDKVINGQDYPEKENFLAEPSKEDLYALIVAGPKFNTLKCHVFEYRVKETLSSVLAKALYEHKDYKTPFDKLMSQVEFEINSARKKN